MYKHQRKQDVRGENSQHPNADSQGSMEVKLEARTRCGSKHLLVTRGSTWLSVGGAVAAAAVPIRSAMHPSKAAALFFLAEFKTGQNSPQEHMAGEEQKGS